MKWIFDDGGRKEAGFYGTADDCVTRSIAIATGIPYREVYDGINLMAKSERTGKRKKKKSSARTGVYPQTTRKYMESIGWEWIPTMQIGLGCKIHLRENELPSGRLIVKCSKHLTAVIDGVIHDTHDPSRDGSRCVYGYFQKRDSVRMNNEAADLILFTIEKIRKHKKLPIKAIEFVQEGMIIRSHCQEYDELIKL